MTMEAVGAATSPGHVPLYRSAGVTNSSPSSPSKVKRRVASGWVLAPASNTAATPARISLQSRRAGRGG